MPLGGLQPSTEEGRDSIVQGLLFESSKTKEYFPVVRPTYKSWTQKLKSKLFPPEIMDESRKGQNAPLSHLILALILER